MPKITLTRWPESAGQARIIQEGSSRNRADAWRNGRLEPRGREAYSQEYVDRLSGETARCSGVSAVAAAMPKLQRELAALELSLAIIKGEDVPEPPRQTGLHEVMDQIRKSVREHSLPAQVYAVLRDAGKPLTGEQIMAALIAKGGTPSKASLMGAIYRAAKQHHLFSLVRPGTFGLLEWPETKG